jgi:hypothetical protein
VTAAENLTAAETAIILAALARKRADRERERELDEQSRLARRGAR